MGRPPNTDPAVTRGRILDAAVATFGPNGREGASIREIARRAGVSMSTVLHHYGNKDRLLEASIQRFVDAAVAHVEAERERLAGAEPHAALRSLTARGVAFAYANRHLVRMVMGERVTTGRTPSSVATEVIGSLLDTLAPTVSAHTGATAPSARLTLMSLVQLLMGYALIEPDELAEQLGLAGASDEPTVARAVEDHLIDVVERLIWGRA